MARDPRGFQAQQMAAGSLDEALARMRANRPVVKSSVARFESWIEGSRGAAAALDSGIQLHGLTLVYWREHKVGWFRIRVVYGVEGSPARISSFKAALAAWAAKLQADGDCS